MAYTPPATGFGAGYLTDAQLAHLDSLEKIAKPSQFNRGQLAALRLSATSDAEQARVNALTDRWAGTEDSSSG